MGYFPGQRIRSCYVRRGFERKRPEWSKRRVGSYQTDAGCFRSQLGKTSERYTREEGRYRWEMVEQLRQDIRDFKAAKQLRTRSGALGCKY